MEHKKSLRNIIAFFSDTEAESKVKERAVLSHSEWIRMVKDLDLLDNTVTMRDASSSMSPQAAHRTR